MRAIKLKVHWLALVAVVAITMLSGAIASQAQAQPPRPNGYPVTNVNLRAGPGTYYPVIVVVPTHAPINIVGCLGDYTWCDVIFDGNRGWMRSIYLKKWYRGYYYSLQDYAPRLGLRIVSFDLDDYWEANYRERPFYRERGKWNGSYGEGWVNRAVFYDRLAPYGDWVWLQGQYVWVPDGVGPHWRPYTIGRWVYTDRYGWMWSSREPFGWATYHYGRWGFSKRVGWFWVPGSRWAPAWVTWRKSDDYLAWAPLPPTSDEGLGISIKIGTVPDYYWQVVQDRDFLADDLPKHIVRDKKRFDPILRRTQPLGNVTVVNNNVVVNNVVNVTYVEQKTNEKVVVHKIEKVKSEKAAGKVKGNAIEVFQPSAAEPPKTVAPPSPKPVEEVAAESKTKEQGQGARSTEELLVPPEIKAVAPPEAAETAPAPPAKPKEGETAPADATPPPPPPALDEAKSPADEEAAPPPPPPPAEAAPPPPGPEEAAPAAPPAETPPAQEAAPPPPPAPAEERPSVPKEEAAPPPPPSSPAEEAPKAKGEKPKKRKGKAKPGDESAPAPPPQEEAAPPAPPPVEESPPSLRKPKGKRSKGEDTQPGGPPSPPASEAPPPPPAASGGAEPPLSAPSAPPKQAAPEGGAGNAPSPEAQPSPPASPPAGETPAPDAGKGGGAPGDACPEGLVPSPEGGCIPAE